MLCAGIVRRSHQFYISTLIMLVAWPPCQWIPAAFVVVHHRGDRVEVLRSNNSAGATFKVQTSATNVLIDPPVHAGTVGIRLTKGIWVGICTARVRMRRWASDENLPMIATPTKFASALRIGLF
jgi:hypothetical protein